MKTHVIILAQGTQQRLTGVTTPKCLLPLPACGDAPIVVRTMRQLFRGSQIGLLPQNPHVTLVSWPEVFAALPAAEYGGRIGGPYHGHTLTKPGNSSLKGIGEVAKDYELFTLALGDEEEPSRIVVLFGDTVYSWNCLYDIMWGNETEHGIMFVGTHDLSAGGGELWGVCWTHPRAAQTMRDAYLGGMRSHPAASLNDTYQPGQLRHWLWALDGVMTMRGVRGRSYYRSLDDYTMDVDLPHHVPLLREASLKASIDDRSKALEWTRG